MALPEAFCSLRLRGVVFLSGRRKKTAASISLKATFLKALEILYLSRTLVFLRQKAYKTLQLEPTWFSRVLGRNIEARTGHFKENIRQISVRINPSTQGATGWRPELCWVLKTDFWSKAITGHREIEYNSSALISSSEKLQRVCGAFAFKSLSFNALHLVLLFTRKSGLDPVQPQIIPERI